jgi:hypothetical protein
VIVIIGEKRTFDVIFATYKPEPGETVDNLLSKGIIDADGTPGPNYSFSDRGQWWAGVQNRSSMAAEKCG